MLEFDYLNQLPNESSRTGQVLHKIMPAAYRAHRQVLGLEGMYAPEALAVAVALHPELITPKRLFGDVEVAGDLTHAATVFDRRRNSIEQPNIDVAVELDVAGAIDCMTRAFQNAP